MVGPVQVDLNGHFLSYGLHHPITSHRRRRDAGNPEARVYYKIAHEDQDLLFNLTVNEEFLSKSYIVERRYGNLSHVKMVASSGPPCHLWGTVLHQGTRIGTAALSSCHGLVSVWFHHLPLQHSLLVLVNIPTTNRFCDALGLCTRIPGVYIILISTYIEKGDGREKVQKICSLDTPGNKDTEVSNEAD